MTTVLANLPDVVPPHAPGVVLQLYAAGVDVGVDSVGLIAQSAYETGWWRYTGKVSLGFCNTAGMKVRDTAVVKSILGTQDDNHPLCHQIFQNWRMGCLAHAWHARRYAGETRAPSPNPDPRWDLVDMSRPAPTWADLSGRWAVPGVGYGERIEELMAQLAQE
ncbi:MAG: hypothetical protein ACRD0W_17170 [Acidimicrobiales bacterium]